VKNTSLGSITVEPDSGTIDGGASFVVSSGNSQTFHCDGSNYILV
jgi:hypothetical protein